MRKFNFNPKYLSISLYAVFVIACAIIIEKILGNLPAIGNIVGIGWNALSSILAPFIYGFFVAYFLNSIVKGLEFNVLNRFKFFNQRPMPRRITSVAVTFIVFIGGIVSTICYIVPEIISNISNLIATLTTYTKSANTFVFSNSAVSDMVNSINNLLSTNFSVSELLGKIVGPITDSLKSLTPFFNTVITGTFSFATGFVKFLIGVIVAFYMLCDKEIFASGFSKILYTIFKRNAAHKIILVARDSNKMFEKFFVGKALDSLILGILFFIVCLITRMPYAILISVIIGVANMIPYFGTIVGSVPVILIVLLNDPIKGLIVFISILVTQWFDNVVISPKVLGDSTGLRPIEVVFAITVGGALFGVIGMFLGVPVFAVLKNMFTNFVNKRYDNKYKAEG